MGYNTKLKFFYCLIKAALMLLKPKEK